MLHLDVKPSNILVTTANEPVLADFGTATIPGQRALADEGNVLTLAYAPRELLEGREPTPAADVYSLCATLYAIMSGRPPRWRPDQAPRLEEIGALYDQPIDALDSMPDWLTDLIRRGMSRVRGNRPTARELQAGIRSRSTRSPEDRITELLRRELRTARSAALEGGADPNETTNDLTDGIARLRRLRELGWRP
ncbi:protein kinase [Dactylosporangium sp. NPDC049742]|uniref:protein kinase domain-containing protein n=1 Tax=Dactylosporangium sp. NPDC049742 TaxID=3154737 RepID=UPI003430CF36